MRKRSAASASCQATGGLGFGVIPFAASSLSLRICSISAIASFMSDFADSSVSPARILCWRASLAFLRSSVPGRRTAPNAAAARTVADRSPSLAISRGRILGSSTAARATRASAATSCLEAAVTAWVRAARAFASPFTCSGRRLRR